MLVVMSQHTPITFSYLELTERQLSIAACTDHTDMALHERLKLYISNDAYTIVGDSEHSPQTLVVSRGSTQDSSIKVKEGAHAPTSYDSRQDIFGVFGLIKLVKSEYLIVITKRKQVAKVLSTAVFTASDFSVYPLERSTTSTLLRHPQEGYLLGLLKTHLFAAPFYFTYGGWNVTCRLQAQRPGHPYETADDRFYWNKHVQQKLLSAAQRFALPLMFGFLEFKYSNINGRDVLFGLVSRRNRNRAGTRYFSRGIDLNGNVSNFNETEQILLLDPPGAAASGGNVRGDIRYSYVQTRGSVPVYWAEINNLRYKPDLQIMDVGQTSESLSKHFKQQVELYGDQFLVNLVNQKGYEKPVKDAYERAVESMNNKRVHYTYFDFHHECKGLRFDRVSVLIDKLDADLQKQGYFFADVTKSEKPQMEQTSVVRTNCMDCLDRTNVVQSALAKWVLNDQLRQAGVLSHKESIEEHQRFLHMFRNVWADNADVISKAYSGTGALKTDYTRTGKRSKEGALQDGVNSLVRYIKNNFLDGPRQDAYDLVTGAWQPEREPAAAAAGDWHADHRDVVTRFAPVAMSFAFGLLLFTFMFPNYVQGRFWATNSTTVSLAAMLLFAAAAMHVVNNGVEYVAWPRLVKLDDVLNYQGKGYVSGRRGRPAAATGVKVRSVEQSAKKAAWKEKRHEALPSLHHGANQPKQD